MQMFILLVLHFFSRVSLTTDCCDREGTYVEVVSVAEVLVLAVHVVILVVVTVLLAETVILFTPLVIFCVDAFSIIICKQSTI